MAQRDVAADDLSGVSVRVDDLSGPEIAALLETHAALMEAITPPESCHYLPLAGLAVPEVTMWSAWEGGELVGCGALKALGGGAGEIKSMHTAAAHRGRGIGTLILAVILAEARRRGYVRLFLETGSAPPFAAARALYERHGFAPCGPFATYAPDPVSAFYTLALTA
jgi:putative acetyltransferase